MPRCTKGLRSDGRALGERQENDEIALLGERDVQDWIVLLRVPSERVEAGAVEHVGPRVMPGRPEHQEASDAAGPMR